MMTISCIIAYSIRRTHFKTLREEVMDLELQHKDPSKVVRHATRARSAENISPESALLPSNV